MDFAAPLGTEVFPCMDGRVIWSSNQRRSGGPSDYGEHIILAHGDGWYTWYGHLSKRVALEGDFVRRGVSLLGEVGSTGYSTGPHLHLTVQHLGHGLDGYIVPDVLDPEPLFEAAWFRSII